MKSRFLAGYSWSNSRFPKLDQAIIACSYDASGKILDLRDENRIQSLCAMFVRTELKTDQERMSFLKESIKAQEAIWGRQMIGGWSDVLLDGILEEESSDRLVKRLTVRAIYVFVHSEIIYYDRRSRPTG